jgi:hypothetical protein
MSGLEPLTCDYEMTQPLPMLLSAGEWFGCVSGILGSDCAQFVQQLLEPEDPFPDPEIGYSARFSAAAAPFTP